MAGVQDSQPAQIKEDLRAIYRKVGNPYMAGAGCEIPIATPLENLKALCEPIVTCVTIMGLLWGTAMG